ncbi:MAG TPA: NYN domain-containing protein [Nocardioides sp.]|uniref:NYN domain-containing protein n=1 Tax=Nocardioides sp. TaxID=35761 RepID=UPI002E366673|nr:NYN domain-containing protein [Nocardioides sp.]HEX5089722.1 NYN domain-containing protein [Nocardioides sp.]
MDLPEAVRARLVSLVAASLGDVTPLPAALKQVAGFAPARRARLGATAIMTELERDEELRGRVGVQARTRANGDALDVAALAWLERPEGWEDAVRRAAEPTPRKSVDAQHEQRERKLRERAEAAEQALRDQRRSHKEALEALKAEVSTLRRTLGETRTKERAARAEAEAARERAEESVARLERELRQLRTQVAKLEEQAGEQRRQARSDRDDVTVRARLLLEALNDAAVGLRRELGLPTVTGNPGDRVEAELAAEAAEGTREPTSTGSMAPSSPALLEQYLALPKARLIVDGYNVTKSTWPTHSLETQRSRLLALMSALVARTGAETTVVFDAAATDSRPVVASPRGVKVLFSPSGVIADDVIRQLVAAEPAGRVVVVVTEDREIVADVRRAGARVVSPAALTRSG